MNQTQIALDSCVVINLIEKPKVAIKLKANLRGKSVKIILCEVVLTEVYRIRGYVASFVIAKISKLLGREIELSKMEDNDKAIALTNQFAICHNGDNKILSLCQAKNFVLVTFDKMLLKTCGFVGVAAFHPLMAGGI
jgi:predicted nucleic acid-binding protein